MSDMNAVIAPKVDQLTADHLIGGPMTILITEVVVRPGTEQPVNIHYEGGAGLPWRPCKSMARVLVAMWGPDSSVYAGKSVRLFRDPGVTWGNLEVGGIRISHMSDIEKIPSALRSMALTAKKGSKKLFKVEPLKLDAPKAEAPSIALKLLSPDGKELAPKNIATWVGWSEAAIAKMEDAAALARWRTEMAPHFLAAEHVDVKAVEHVQGVLQDRLDALAEKAPAGEVSDDAIPF